MKFSRDVLVNLVASLVAAAIISLIIRVMGYLETGDVHTVEKILTILMAIMVAGIIAAWISEGVAKNAKLNEVRVRAAENIQSIAAFTALTSAIVGLFIFIFYFPVPW
ncbi:MAG: hypothetical protein LC776_10420 [Acidobacteria bacterium]|nr:hypothetical protein [Acidobacteriota bacterium]